MAHRHVRHRTMRLRKHRHPRSSSTAAATTATATTRPRQPSSSDSSDGSDSNKEANVPEAALEERRRRAEEAKNVAKAQAMLNSEVKHASHDSKVARAADAAPAVSSNVGSVSSERGSYLARLSAQAEASATAKREKRERGEEDDDDDDSVHWRSRRGGIVRRVAERHHRKAEKREKQRRMERLRRIAALDPMKEAERQHGQAKETTFMALIRKYGSMAQESSPSTTDDQPLRRAEQDATTTTTDTSPTSESSSSFDDEHSAYLVDTLDVVDPGVSAAGHLSNIGNSLIFPNIPGLYDRRPVIDLPAQEVDEQAAETEATLQLEEGRHPPAPRNTAATNQDDLHLDAYVHELLTKKQKFKRAMQGVWAFLKTPVGVIAGIYGFLVVFGGAALVLFLVGAIDGGKNKDYWVEVWSQFENALFTIPGVGLIPWRLRDTWRMGWIAYYQHLTRRLRKKRGLPRLQDKNDVPSVAQKKKHEKNKEPAEGDNENTSDEESSTPVELDKDAVLTPHQATHLSNLQSAFAESQSWYRPHETFTHHAFSISFALWITIFNDLNSLFQCLLCGYMWGYATHYRDRPAWSTGTFMPCSFLAGIAAGVLIWKGGERSKKKGEVEEKLLAAFARDVDARVEMMRVEAEQGRREQETGLARVEEVGEGIDLGRLAGEIAEKS
ncbi:hypothetical protein PHBOTO_003522 [Pseudozyma hubeiensis]|nr:hypothetical protein PHBOTO_003522 [Pseudozyma hubeiensis]